MAENVRADEDVKRDAYIHILALDSVIWAMLQTLASWDEQLVADVAADFCENLDINANIDGEIRAQALDSFGEILEKLIDSEKIKKQEVVKAINSSVDALEAASSQVCLAINKSKPVHYLNLIYELR